MASAANSTSLSVLHKIVYDNGVEESVYQGRPLTAAIKKKGNAPNSYSWDVRYALPQNTSATFANAQTHSTTKTSAVAQFTVNLADLFAEGTIANKSIKTTKGAGAKAFEEMLRFEFSGTLDNMANQMETALARSGYGELGTVSAINSNTVTLSLRSDVKNLEVGAVLVANTAGMTGATRAGSMTITSISRGNGTFTCSGGLVASLAANDTIHLQGSTNGSTTRKVIHGLEAWNPFIAPVGGENFNGVDRSLDEYRLAGVRLDRTGSAGSSLEEASIDLLTEVCDNEGTPDMLLVSSKTWGGFVKELGVRTVYGRVEMEDDKAKMGYRSIVIAGPRGDVDLVVCRAIPDNQIRAITSDGWEIMHAGSELIDLVETSGKTVRQSADPGQAYQYESFAQLICKTPWKNGVVKIDVA